MSVLPWDLRFDLVPCGLTVSADFSPVEQLLQLTLHNNGGAPVAPGRVEFVAGLGLPAVSGYTWIHGRYMQMDALVHRFAEPLAEGEGDIQHFYQELGDGSHRYISRELIGLYAPARSMPALLVGSVRGDRFFTDLEVELDEDEFELGTLRLAFDIEATAVAPGEQLKLPPLWLGDGSDLHALAERYAAAAAKHLGARVPAHIPTGWCSWYSYYDRVTEDDVVANLEHLREHRLPIDYFLIDDGYQSKTGDWLTPNAKFPSGLTTLAASIRDAGYRPGLWLAPLVLHEDAVALRDYPEIALRDHNGEQIVVETWLGRCAVLDCSHPAAESWLRTVVQVLAQDWGYDVLKLDALAFAAQPSTTAAYHDTSFTAPRNLRRGLEIIREAAGDRTFLLGCTCHFAPALGLVDGMRVGPDVKTIWADGTSPSVRHAMRLALQRNFMHMRWWANDPDCLVLRDVDTSLSPAEVRFLLAAVALTGGMAVSGDALQSLSPERRQMLELALPPTGVAALPYEPGDGPVPSAWRADLCDGRFLVGVLNWTDEPAWVHVDEYLMPGEVAFEVLRGQMLGKGDVRLEPHDATLWQVTEPGRGPRVVGDAGHLNYARLSQRPVSGRLQLGNDLDHPRTVAVEARRQVFEVVLQPGERRWFD